MKTRILICSFALIFLVATCSLAAEVSQSTIEDQKEVEVTVYNSNIGLVKDMRVIDLPKGEGELRFMDVASHIMPVTVHVKSLNHPEQFMVLEQNYEYDLMDANKLLDKYVGKDIKLINENQYQNTTEIIEAKLLSNNNGQIFKIDNEIYLGHPGYRVLPELPENLIAKPTLTWMYKNVGTAPHRIEVSYLTNNIGWKADYVVVLDQKDVTASVNGWISLDNRSGAMYKDAKLKLVAGDLNRVQQREQWARAKADVAFESLGAGAPQFEEKGFFEYHIYDLQRKTTIKNNQTKQISLLEAQDVSVKKEFVINGQQYWYTGQYSGQDLKTPVYVYVLFKNEEENNMGMPLPAGVMRLYKEDDEGSLQFIGEDRIEHTPKDEEVKLKIGEAFDVVAERKQTDYQNLGNWGTETAWEITLRNHKKEDVTVNLLEPIRGDWQIMNSSHNYEKVDAFTAKFVVPIAKDEEVKVRYRVRLKYR